MPKPQIISKVQDVVTNVASSPAVKLTATVTAMVVVTGAAIAVTTYINKKIEASGE